MVFRERAPKNFLTLAALVGNGFFPQTQNLKVGRKKEDKSIIVASDSEKNGTESMGEEIIHMDDT